MKTILLISPYWKEQHRWMVSSFKLAELWQQLGYRVVVACMGKETKVDRVSDTLTVYSRKDFFIPDPWNYGIAFGFRGFVSGLLHTEKPDLIVINKLLFWTSLTLFPLRLRKRKVIVITDAFVGMTWWPRHRVPKIAAAIYGWTIGWLILALATKIVTFHPQPTSLLKKLGIAPKTEVIPTGIDPSLYTPHVHQVGAEVTVTYVGRLESVKGVDDFLAAAVPLKKEFPSLKIQVIGWYKEAHPLLAQYDKEVIFTGLREDIPDILRQSDLFVLPSYSEGLSNALMEAMASGCACVASDVGGNRFLLQNGISGFLFPAGDREALSSHLRRLLKDPAKRKSLGEAARKRIEDQFSWTVVGKSYQHLFASVLEHA